jgi:hypothetical protein
VIVSFGPGTSIIPSRLVAPSSGSSQGNSSHKPLACGHRGLRHTGFEALHLDSGYLHPVAVEVAPKDLDRAGTVEGSAQEGHQRFTVQDGLDAGRSTCNCVGGDVAGADDQVHRGPLLGSDTALMARPRIPAPCDALFHVTGPCGGLWDRLSAYSGTNLPGLGGTFAGATPMNQGNGSHVKRPDTASGYLQKLRLDHSQASQNFGW